MNLNTTVVTQGTLDDDDDTASLKPEIATACFKENELAASITHSDDVRTPAVQINT